MPTVNAVQLRPATVAAARPKVPIISHPLSTPGYVLIVHFIFSCIFNVLVFALTYSFLALVVPISLVVKIAQKCIVCVRVLSQGGQNAVLGDANEKYWFVGTNEMYSPSLIVLLIVKGRLGIDTMNYLVRNRLSYSKDDEERTHLRRLARTPRPICHEIVWFENDCNDKLVKEINVDRMHIFDFGRRKFTIENTPLNKDWHVYLYSNRENLADNDLILFQFHHCFADVYTLVHFISRNFLDQPIFAFRDEISSAQALCLGFLALLGGPTIFAKNLLKSKDTLFMKPVTNKERAIFYSGPVSSVLIETITTATGASASDVVLSCLAGGLRACLRQKGIVFPSDITAYLPLNLQSSSSLKCFTSFNILSLPVATEGAIPRLWEMRLRRNNISSLIQAIIMSTIMQLAFLILPNTWARHLIQFLMSKCSCTVTCILGQALEEELLIDGRTVESFLPVEDNGAGLSITVTEYEQKFQLTVLAPTAEDWVIHPAQLCTSFTCQLHELSTRLAERARVVRARGQKILNSRKNSVFAVDEEEE